MRRDQLVYLSWLGILSLSHNPSPLSMIELLLLYKARRALHTNTLGFPHLLPVREQMLERSEEVQHSKIASMLQIMDGIASP